MSNNSQLQTASFDGIPVSIIDHNDEGWITGEDIGKALDYADDPRNAVRKIFERNREELEDYSVTVKLTATDNKQYNTRVYNEEGVMMIGFFSKQPKAVAFRRWAVKTLKDYRNSNQGLDSDTLTSLLNPANKTMTVTEFTQWRSSVKIALNHVIKESITSISVIASADDYLDLVMGKNTPDTNKLVKGMATYEPINPVQPNEAQQKRKLRLWRNKEIEQLKTYYADGLTYEEIGLKLGRSSRSIANAVSRYIIKGGAV